MKEKSFLQHSARTTCPCIRNRWSKEATNVNTKTRQPTLFPLCTSLCLKIHVWGKHTTAEQDENTHLEGQYFYENNWTTVLLLYVAFVECNIFGPTYTVNTFSIRSSRINFILNMNRFVLFIRHTTGQFIIWYD